MNEFIESLKRLYEAHKIDDETIKKLCSAGKLSEDEAFYILRKDGDE